MSMLAEPKRKKKWSLNPRGKLWSNDDTKLGQKLLEKMGWSKGKGLGREEQGDLEPVRLKYKNDAEGVGFVAKDDQWIAHHEEFNAILGKLNGSDTPAPVPETVPVKSLEVRSKVSKARVHYHKFTRGKDLSRYSESDLASILGKRAASSNPSSDDEKVAEVKAEVTEEVVEKIEIETNESSSDTEHSHGVTTINKGNIHEYFAAKMAALKAKSQPTQQTETTSDQANQDVPNAEKRVRINEDLNQVKEFCSKKKITEWSQETLTKSTEFSDGETEKKKEKKKKKKSKSTEAGEAVVLDCDANQETEPPKSKKRKLEEEVSEQAPEETAPKKKKKKDKDNQENYPPTQTNDDAPEEVNEPKKKKKKCTDDDDDNGDESNEIKKSKKKKKKEKSDEDAEITQQTEAAEPSETGEAAKKKKKKNKSEADAGSAVAANQSDHPEVAETERPKKMKKKKSQSEEEDSCTAASSDEVTSENQETSASKKKKKKNKKKKVNGDSTAEDATRLQSDPLLETASVPCAEKSVNARPSVPSAAQNNYPAPDFSFISKPSKVQESIAKYEKASFEMFKGSNLFSLSGYGNAC